MRASKAKKLRAAGWKAGTAKEFLGLSEDEAALVELNLALVAAVKEARTNAVGIRVVQCAHVPPGYRVRV